MKAVSISLIVLGVVIFIISMTGGGLLFVLPVPSILLSILWFVGVMLVALGLYFLSKTKKKVV